MWRAVIIVSLLGSVIGAALLLTLRDRRDRRPAVDKDNHLTADVEALRAEVARLQSLQAAGIASQTRYLAEPSALVPESARAPSTAKQPETQASTVERLERAFARDPIDIDWSRGMVVRMSDAIKSSSPGSSILSAECATALCRV